MPLAQRSPGSVASIRRIHERREVQSTPEQPSTGVLVPPELIGRLTITVPEAAHYYGISRNAAYEACAAGTIPSLRISKRVLVPVAKMLAQLGIEEG